MSLIILVTRTFLHLFKNCVCVHACARVSVCITKVISVDPIKNYF